MLAKKVLELYERVGWTQGAYWRDEFDRSCPPLDATCMCLAGAAIVVGVPGESFRSIERLTVELKFNKPSELQAWNDAPGRTFEQVKLRLEAACYKPDHNGVMGGDFGQRGGSM